MVHLVYADSQSKRAQTEAGEQINNATMQQPEVLDPVCGMRVDPSKAAASINHRGVTVYFCGQGCAAKFRASPEKYLEAASQDRAAWGIYLPHASTDQKAGTC
jgi:YHS domain-containing protein